MAPSRNLEVIADVNRALSEHGTEGVVRFYAQDCEFHMPPDWIEQNLYRGREGFRKLSDAWFGQFDDYRWVPVELEELDGDRVLGLYLMQGRSRGSDVPIEQHVGLITTIEGGLITYTEAFFTWEDARAAAHPG